MLVVGGLANSVDPDQTPRSAASDLDLCYLLRHICPDTLDTYATLYLNH